MTIDFFFHGDVPENQNERRAIIQVARLLSDHFRESERYYALVANVNPFIDNRWRYRANLTQLEGILFGPDFVILLEFKECFAPIVAESLDDRWYTESQDGASLVPLRGGARLNPFLQVRHARTGWLSYFQKMSQKLFSIERDRQLHEAWKDLSSALLFCPFLHKESQLPPLGRHGKWLSIGGINDVAAIARGTHSNRLQLSQPEIETLLYHALRARDWSELHQLFPRQIGSFLSHESTKEATEHPIYSYEEFTVGRSASQGHRITVTDRAVSSSHLWVTARRDAVRIYDLNSFNGTVVHQNDGETRIVVDSVTGHLLQNGDEILLGSSNCRLKFYTSRPLSGTPPTITPQTKIKGPDA